MRSKKFDKTFLRVIGNENDLIMSHTLSLSLLEWYWKILIRRWVYRVIAVIIGFLSLCIVWSEVLFGVVNPHLSIFAYLVFVGHQLGKYSAIEVGVATKLLYFTVVY